MFGIGFVELLLLAAVGLVILGPEKLPVAARNLGLWYGKIQRMLSNMQQDIETELNLQEAKKQMQEELEKIRKAEEEMKLNMQKMQKDIDAMQKTTESSEQASKSAETTIETTQ